MSQKEFSSASDYYSLLNCTSDASHDELKQNYQKLIRKYHPDKSELCNNQFSHIDKAWKTLRNKDSRQQYDNYLQTLFDTKNVVVHATINKQDLCFKNQNITTYSCRCGGTFVIYEDYLVAEECAVECDECSNYIVIKQF